jgi:predicted RNA-binding protein with PIN domain
VVKRLQTNCKQEGRVKGFFGEVIKLFGEQQELKIIRNKDLNKILSQLISHLSSYVAIANKSIVVTVSHRFNEGSK